MKKIVAILVSIMFVLSVTGLCFAAPADKAEAPAKDQAVKADDQTKADDKAPVDKKAKKAKKSKKAKKEALKEEAPAK